MQFKFGKSPAPGHILRIVQDYTKEETKVMSDNAKTVVQNATAAKQDAERTLAMLSETLGA